MKLTEHNEAVFPLELGEDEYIATRPFDTNWQEFIVFKVVDKTQIELLARDKLHYQDHIQEIKKLLVQSKYTLKIIYSSYKSSSTTSQRAVFRISIMDKNFEDEILEFEVINKLPMGMYPRFDGQVLYSKQRKGLI